MSLDLTLLRLLKYRGRYQRLAKAVPANAVDEYTKILLKDFGAYFAEFGDADKIDAESFMLWFKGFRHPGLKPEALAVFGNVIHNVVAEDVSEDITSGIMERLIGADTAAQLADLIAKWSAGEDVDLYLGARNLVQQYELQTTRKIKNPQALDRIEDILKDEEDLRGFSFRQPELNRSIKPLLDEFLVMAARPDKGKTTFWADNLTHMAAQVDTVYPGENRSILWLNNEGASRKIIMRVWQAALGATVEELARQSHLPATTPAYRHALHERYVKAIGGREDALRIFSIHDMWSHEVEEIIERNRPAGVLFDMVDNIKFGGQVGNNGQRTDQLLEAMYQWARLMGVKHDCFVAATSQVSADGDGLQYPTLPMLKDSKTGKQGAADVILVMGALNDPNFENSRYFGCTKNKKVPTGMPKSPNVEMHFDGDRARIYVPQQR